MAAANNNMRLCAACPVGKAEPGKCSITATGSATLAVFFAADQQLFNGRRRRRSVPDKYSTAQRQFGMTATA